jgi:chromosome segregation ATPase
VPPSEVVTKDVREGEPTEQVTVSGPDDPTSTTGPGSLPVPSRSNTVVEQHAVDPASAKDVLEIVLRGEQERREMMYHVTREVSRLREAVEQQHELLEEVTEQVSDYTKRLAGAFTTPPLSGTDVTSQELSQDDFDGRLRELEEALTREQEVVERLRKSKLDLERRTADAEAQLEDLRNRSLIERLLGRHDD